MYAPYLIYVLAYIHLNPLKANMITKLDSEYAWTSHRKYMNGDLEPLWLTTNTFLGFYESASEMEELILRLHRKADPWPAGMTDKGWFKLHLCPVDVVTKEEGTEGQEEIEVDELLDRICKTCEVERGRFDERCEGTERKPRASICRLGAQAEYLYDTKGDCRSSRYDS